MKKIPLILTSLVLVLAGAIFLSTKVRTTATISEEVFASLPGCKVGDPPKAGETLNAKDLANGELCAQSKLDYLSSSDKPAGVTYEYWIDF